MPELINPMTHVQDIASSTWVIEHNRGVRPGVSVAVHHEGVLQAILPASIEYPSLNVVEVKFTSPRTGEARLV